MNETLQGYRCLNDLFGYCAGKPRGGVKRVEPIGAEPYDVPCCRLNKDKCGNYRTADQELAGKHPQETEANNGDKS